MSKVFVKQADLKLVNGGYVVVGENETPVSNYQFIQAQRSAEYIVTFADACKGKDFNGKSADSIEDVRNEVVRKLNNNKKEYISVGKEPVRKITKGLADEALAFMDFDKKKGETAKVNEFLQEFNVIEEFEEFGLFFEQEVVKLNKIYTMKEIIDAVKATINML